jgi:hypothetical protein
MADYRLYMLNLDGHILRAADLKARDDDEAIARLRARGEPTDIELWCGKRRVALVPRAGGAADPENPDRPPTG